jgi:peptidoglycan/LPS O-acetylase OafA/YrhL
MLIISCRLLWSGAVAWIIFACHHGKGGFINRLLSSKRWEPFSKLGLSVYMVSSVLQYILTASKDQQIDLDPTQMVRLSSNFRKCINSFDFQFYNFLMDVAMSTLGAVLLYRFVEEPFAQGSKALWRKLKIDK